MIKQIPKRDLIGVLMAFLFIQGICAQTTTVVDDVLYLIEEDGAVVARQDRNLAGDIFIPESIVYEDAVVPVVRIVEPTIADRYADNIAQFEGGAFQECQVTSVILPETIKEIPAGSFFNCPMLEKVVLPSEIVSLGMGAFARCEVLNDVTIPSTIETIEWNTFGDTPALTSIEIPASVKWIDNGAFKRSGLKGLDIPATVEEIREDAFACPELEWVKVHWRNQQAFQCSLQAFTDVPETCVLYIPQDAEKVYGIEPWIDFSKIEGYDDGETGPLEYKYVTYYFNDIAYLLNIENKTALVGRQRKTLSGDIVILSQVEYEGNIYDVNGFVDPIFYMGVVDGTMHGYGGAFQGSLITSVTIPSSITQIGMLAFMECHELKKVILPDNLEIIGACAFAYCENLEEINLPLSLTEIGCDTDYGYWSFVFGFCSSLKSLTVPPGVTNIADGCFLMSGLEELVLPENIVNISDGAINVENLKELYLYVADPNQIAYTESSFGDVSHTDLFVPLGSAAYYSEFYPWMDFASIQEFDAGQEPFEGELNVAHIDNIRYWLYPETQTAIIGRQNKDLSGDIEIPETLNIDGIEYTVTGLISPTSFEAFTDHTVTTQGGAFQDCQITSIKLPSTIFTIPEGAFYNCNLLNYVELPENLTQLSSGCFAHCVMLQEIFIPETVTELGSETGYGRCSYVFGECNSLKKINIPRGITVIPVGCFKNSGLNTFLITDNMTVLERGCFELPELEYVKSELSSLEGLTYTESIFPETISEVLLLVPEGCKELYSQFYPWKNFREIQEFVETNDEYQYNAYGIITELSVQEETDPSSKPRKALGISEENNIEILEAYMPSGKDFNDIPVPEIEGYEFLGWAELPEFMPADDIVLTAIVRKLPTVEPTPLPEPTVTPVEETVESLSVITVTWEGRPIAINEENDEPISVKFSSGEEEYPLEISVENENALLVINLLEPSTLPGDYTISIPAGYVLVGEPEDETFEVVQPNESLEFTYIIEEETPEPGPEPTPDITPLPVPVISPAVGTIESLDVVSISWDERPLMINKDNKDEIVITYSSDSVSDETLEFTVSVKNGYLSITPEEIAIEPGTYIINIPAAYVMISEPEDETFASVQPNKALELIYVIKSNEVSGLGSILDSETGYYDVFDMKGRMIIKSGNIEKVKALESGLYLINGKKVFILK